MAWYDFSFWGRHTRPRKYENDLGGVCTAVFEALKRETRGDEGGAAAYESPRNGDAQSGKSEGVEDMIGDKAAGSFMELLPPLQRIWRGQMEILGVLAPDAMDTVDCHNRSGGGGARFTPLHIAALHRAWLLPAEARLEVLASNGFGEDLATSFARVSAQHHPQMAFGSVLPVTSYLPLSDGREGLLWLLMQFGARIYLPTSNPPLLHLLCAAGCTLDAMQAAIVRLRIDAEEYRSMAQDRGEVSTAQPQLYLPSFLILLENSPPLLLLSLFLFLSLWGSICVYALSVPSPGSCHRPSKTTGMDGTGVPCGH